MTSQDWTAVPVADPVEDIIPESVEIPIADPVTMSNNDSVPEEDKLPDSIDIDKSCNEIVDLSSILFSGSTVK